MLLEISRTIEFSPSLVPAKAPASPRRGFLFAKRRSVAGRLPHKASALMLGSCVGDRDPRADGQGGELIDGVASGTPVRKLLLVELLGHARGCHSPGIGRITALGSSSPQSTRIVQRKRRTTSNVDSDDGVPGEPRRDRFETSLVRWVRKVPISMRTNGPACMRTAWRKGDLPGQPRGFRLLVAFTREQPVS